MTLMLREKFIADGFVKVSGFFSADEIDHFSRLSEGLLDLCADRHAARLKVQGSLIPTIAEPGFVDLVMHPRLLTLLAAMGWQNPSYSDGYVISKPPGGAPLFWHYDWFAWDDPVSSRPEPAQIFIMVYLQKTDRANGCLRVIPGCHRCHNSLHDLIGEPHGEHLSAADNLHDPAFSVRPDEIDVAVQIGDLLIGDARLLHAAHSNGSAERRTLLTLWYQPDFATLPEGVRAQIAAKVQMPRGDYPASARARLEAIWPVYAGSVPPHPRTLYAASGEAL